MESLNVSESNLVNISLAKVVFIGILVAVAYGLVALLTFLLGRFADHFPNRRLLFMRLGPVMRIVVFCVAIYQSIKIISPEEESLYAILGSMAIGLGLAAKDLLNDLIGGIVINFDRSFQVGDRVAAGGHYGEVVSIGLRSTKLVTADDNLVTVPNSIVLSSSIANANAGSLDCQVVVDIYLPAGADLGLVEDIARDAVFTSKWAFLKKPVVVNVKDEFKETLLTRLVVKAYVFDARFENAFAADLTRRIKKELAQQHLLPADARFVGLGVGADNKGEKKRKHLKDSIFCPSGTWKNWHADSVPVWGPVWRRYILVGLVEAPTAPISSRSWLPPLRRFSRTAKTPQTLAPD